jgi:DNA mismatch endonuclease (patch repair protein)
VRKLSDEERYRIMAAIRSKNTKPELTLRKALWSRGIRYRVHYGKEKIDIAFPSKKIAVFIDGCFWHACPLHFREPRNNVSYWRAKIERNVRRDAEKNDRLKLSGWQVVRFWEHELKDVDAVSGKVQTLLQEQDSARKI